MANRDSADVAAGAGSPADDEWYAAAVAAADADAYGEPDEEAPPPAWVWRAAVENLRAAVTDAATARPGGATADILERACPDGPPRSDPVEILRGGDAARVGPAELDAAGVLSGIVAAGRLIGWAQAIQQRYIAALARPGIVMHAEDLIDLCASPLGLGAPVPDEPIAALLREPRWEAALRDAAIAVASTEIGCALHLSPMSARSRTENAVAMVDTLPATLEAQQRGEIDSYRASIIAERAAVLGRRDRHAVEEAVLPFAARRSPSRLREIIDREVVRLDPDAAARREHSARRGRGVRVDADTDGMARFSANLPAPDAQLVYGVLDGMATATKAAGLAAGRGQNQLRADAFVALFRDLATAGPSAAGGAASGRRLPLCLNVYVAASTLAGIDDEPADLAGHGVISADLARSLAKSAAAARAIVVTPVRASGSDTVRTRYCGTVLDAGRLVYRPPERIADHVTTRDRICSFPMCRTPAGRCDLDHRIPFGAGGDTCPHNLDALCRFHHAIKTFTPWRAEPGADGRLGWTAPLGRPYPTEPGHLLLERCSATRGGTGAGDGGDPPGDPPSAPADDPPPF